MVVALDDFDLAPQMKSSRHFNPTIVGNAFNVYSHGCGRLSRSQYEKVTRSGAGEVIGLLEKELGCTLA
jgi:hypothetical protein